MNSFWLDMQMTEQALQTIKRNNSLWKKSEKKWKIIHLVLLLLIHFNNCDNKKYNIIHSLLFLSNSINNNCNTFQNTKNFTNKM